jgi:mannose-6-phosphate isomerase-like protein (cupin superfamily)
MKGQTVNQTDGSVVTASAADREEYVEPVGTALTGNPRAAQPAEPYDEFMAAEGIPCYRHFGVPDLTGLELGDWPRMGGRGAYLQFRGSEGLWGMYVLEIPPRGSVPVEKHLYEEIFMVLRGRGSTEIGAGGAAQFEWGPGSLFSIPVNTVHSLHNLTNEPAFVLAATTAPPLFNLFNDPAFVFNSDYDFARGAQAAAVEYDPVIYRSRGTGRAELRTAFVPDIVNMALPLDNQRSTGYRRVSARMPNSRFRMFIGQHEIGRYAKAHHHPPGPVLICLQGEGYTLTWPTALGPRPWENGHGDQVIRVDYTPGGAVAAAPGGADWYHQHFAVGSVPLRVLALLGLGYTGTGVAPGEKPPPMNLDEDEGGRSVGYPREDPFVRLTFEAELAKRGVTSRMDEVLYRAKA